MQHLSLAIMQSNALSALKAADKNMYYALAVPLCFCICCHVVFLTFLQKKIFIFELFNCGCISGLSEKIVGYISQLLTA